jgi:DNA polymerase-4
VIHLSVADFPIAVEEIMEPRLRGRPAAVAVKTASRALVVSASLAARGQGIYRGMPLETAMQRCRDLTVLPPNPDLYARADAAVMQLLQRFSPLIEPLHGGDVYLDMTGSDRLFGSVGDAAVRAQREIRERLRLQVTAGVAGNKLVSKVASDVIDRSGKVGGLCDVRAGDEPDFLAPLDVAFLPGVGRSVRQQLAMLNIRVIREIVGVSSEHLQMVFGRFGLLLYQRSRGIDNRPVQPSRRPPQIVETETLQPDSNDFRVVRRAVFHLVDRAGRRLRRQKLVAAVLAFEVRYSDYREHRVEVKLPPTADDSEWVAEVDGGLERLLQRRVRVRTIAVRLLNLQPPSQQLLLFAPTTTRASLLTAAMDKIRDRYGDEAVGFGRAA